MLISCQQSVTMSKCGVGKCRLHFMSVNLRGFPLFPDRWPELIFSSEKEKIYISVEIIHDSYKFIDIIFLNHVTFKYSTVRKSTELVI